MGSSNPGSSPQVQLLDFHQLESYSVIGVEDYLRLLGDVIVDIPNQMAEIRDAVEQGNAPQFKARAHGLRGLVAYFGCVAMAARLAQLENQEDIAPTLASAIHTELQVIWEQSLAALNIWRQSMTDL